MCRSMFAAVNHHGTATKCRNAYIRSYVCYTHIRSSIESPHKSLFNLFLINKLYNITICKHVNCMLLIPKSLIDFSLSLCITIYPRILIQEHSMI